MGRPGQRGRTGGTLTIAGPGRDRADRDREYSPSSRVPDLNLFLREYAARTASVREALTWREHRYGPSPDERLDFYPAKAATEAGTALHVFIHGGYWQELGTADSAFTAAAFVGRGVSFAALGYGLAPSYRLGEIVAMVRRGLWWLVRNASEFGINPGRIVVSGSSAGAHLAAMGLLPDGSMTTPSQRRLPIAGALLLSGVYDLEPLRHTYVGDSIRLTAAEAVDNSPIRKLVCGLPPIVVARGGNETSAFGWQQDRFVAALTAVHAPVQALVVHSRNHFDLPFDLADLETPLGRMAFALESGAGDLAAHA